jgi:hypothetical protein
LGEIHGLISLKASEDAECAEEGDREVHWLERCSLFCLPGQRNGQARPPGIPFFRSGNFELLVVFSE